jgi:hypothetical protein
LSILPARVLLPDIRQGRMIAVPMEAGLVRPLGILHRRRKLHRAAQLFLDLLQEQPAEAPSPEPVSS